MTEYELHSLINDLFRDMDHMVEFWLSATFAVIVARFVAGDTLSRGVIRIIAFLYLAATSLSITRYGLVAGRTGSYKDQLVAMGLEPFYQPAEQNRTMYVLILTLWFVGTGATLYFLLRKTPQAEAEAPATEET
jgi:hypothetical protein